MSDLTQRPSALPRARGLSAGRSSSRRRLGAALALAALASAATLGAQAVSALDSEGRRISLASRPARVVSLGPSITEALFAAGAGGRLVGATTYCDYPEAAKSLPRVGGFSAKTISVEKVLALRPDLVVSSGSIHRSVEEALLRLGVPVFSYSPDSFEAIARELRALGELAGDPAAAEAAGRAMLATIAAVRERLAGVPAESRPRVFWEIYDEPLMTAGAATFQHAILVAAGGRPIFDELPGSWPRVSAEEVIKRAPEVIMGADDHGDRMSVAHIASRPGWGAVPAVRSGRVVLMPAALVSRPAPRVAEGVLLAARALYPALFP